MPDDKPCHVLVVDDHPDGAVSTALLLEAMGNYVVRVAHSAEEAHVVAAALKPDVVLMDLGLPGKDGYALADELRGRFPLVRLIALSGYGTAHDIHRSIQRGFDQHLVKPADPDELNGAVHQACEARHPRACDCAEN